MNTLAISSRWERIRNALGIGCRTVRRGLKTQQRRRLSFEPLEDRTLLSVYHWTGNADNKWSNDQNWDCAPRLQLTRSACLPLYWLIRQR